MSLTRDQLSRRLRDVDFRIVSAMNCETMQASAHRSGSDARQERNAITRREDAGEARFYRVRYNIRTLLGAGAYSDPGKQPVILLVDLTKNGDYPYTRPESYIIGPVTPWSPHFLSGVPVCFEVPGRVWTPDGSKTLGHLLLHIARLINFDEEIVDPTYVGYNGQAIAYWRGAPLRGGPITKKLRYPILPEWYYNPVPSAPSGPGATVRGTTDRPRAAIVKNDGKQASARRARIAPTDSR